MNLLYALESVRTPFWDAVFSAVTHLGEETVFMVAAILREIEEGGGGDHLKLRGLHIALGKPFCHRLDLLHCRSKSLVWNHLAIDLNPLSKFDHIGRSKQPCSIPGGL